jgi:hypothetical protein
LADVHASAAFTGLAAGILHRRVLHHYNAAATTTGARFALNGTITQDYLSYLIGYSTQSGDGHRANADVRWWSRPHRRQDTTSGNNAILQFTVNVTVAGDIRLSFASEVGGSAITVTNVIGFIRRVS